MNESKHPDFSGKHVLFYLSNSPGSYLVQDIDFQEFGGRLFLTGRASEALEEDAWTRNLPVGFDWAAIERYIVFESGEDYRNRIAVWESKNREKLNDDKKLSIWHRPRQKN
jgi:hypothetical protein